ncbi:MAG: DUF1587 domain-containing protein, partial [Planctomycetota bacterium]|nr:DUF1587 domain-containing protein [Planctomycetota bacterium]
MSKPRLFITAAVLIALAATTAIVRSDDVTSDDVAAGIPAPVAPPTTVPAGEYHSTVLPLLQKYCYECHADGMDSGDLEMDSYESLQDLRNDVKTWQKVLQYARTQTMPPPKADQPTQDERDALVEALHRELYQIDPANPDPGRVTVRRLNRTEYRNTIRDLIGVTFDPTIDFPQDDTGYGFDNIADVLTLPPMLMEKYLAATERIMEAAIPTDSVASAERRVPATRAQRSGGGRSSGEADAEWVKLSSRTEDALSVAMQGATRADYVVRVLAYAKPRVNAAAAAALSRAEPAAPAGGYDLSDSKRTCPDATDSSHWREPADAQPATTQPVAPADAVLAATQPVRLSIGVGDTVYANVDVAGSADQPQWYEARVGVPAGRQTIRAAVRRDRSSPTTMPLIAGRVGEEQPGDVFVKEIVIMGPVQGAVRRVDNDRFEVSGNAAKQQEAVALTRTGDEVAATVDVQATGEHLVRLIAFADHAGDEVPKLE